PPVPPPLLFRPDGYPPAAPLQAARPAGSGRPRPRCLPLRPRCSCRSRPYRCSRPGRPRGPVPPRGRRAARPRPPARPGSGGGGAFLAAGGRGGDRGGGGRLGAPSSRRRPHRRALPAGGRALRRRPGLAAAGDRLFNHQNWGGFIGWRLRVPVFWDGRNDVFAELGREFATQPFGLTASRYHLDWLPLAEDDYPVIQPEIAAGHWGLVYWDDFCAVYLRRGPRYAEPLGRLELRLFPPFGGRPGLRALVADPALAAAARAELARLLAANPENQRPRYSRGMISLYQGALRRATAELQAARSIRHNDQVEQVL